MPPIDSANLKRAMERSGATPKHVAAEVGISLQYVCDLLSGYRTLKRNPAMRKRIAEVLDVPVHWIEHSDPSQEAS